MIQFFNKRFALLYLVSLGATICMSSKLFYIQEYYNNLEEMLNLQQQEHSMQKLHPSSMSEHTVKKESLAMQAFVKEWLDEANIPPQTPGAFLHVGKTGGSTLSTYLRNGCFSFIKKPCQGKDLYNESFVSQLTTYYHNPDFDTLGSVPHKFYIITMRDPLSRLKSMFTYMHPANIQITEPKKRFRKDAISFYSCFRTLESFAKMLDYAPHEYKYKSPNLGKLYLEEECSNLAWAIMSGYRIKAIDHFYWGLSTLHQLLEQTHNFNNATILAIRQEHIWDDWKSANAYLGQQNVVTHESTKAKDYSKKELPVTKELSEQGQKQLCLALNEEYDKYIIFLQRASNLDSNAKQASLELAQNNCPWLNLTLTI